MSQSAAVTSRNEVVLVGRLSAPPTMKLLPSGDELLSFRVVVDRAPSGRRVPEGVRTPTVDTIDCVAWSAAVQRAAATWEEQDLIEVQGQLRRRFWRGGGGPQSLCEVEVSKAKRVKRAA